MFTVDGSPGDTPKMEIEFTTACGSQRLPVRIVSREQQPRKVTFGVALPPDHSSPRRTSVWSDAPKGSEIKIGKATIVAPHGEVHGLLCAESHPVTVAGTTVGTLAGATESVFVATHSNDCFKLRSLMFGDSRHGSTEALWSGQHIYRFTGDVDFFLEQAPTEIRSPGREARRTQIERVACR